jgi:hypothetical protein
MRRVMISDRQGSMEGRGPRGRSRQPANAPYATANIVGMPALQTTYNSEHQRSAGGDMEHSVRQQKAANLNYANADTPHKGWCARW